MLQRSMVGCSPASPDNDTRRRRGRRASIGVFHHGDKIKPKEAIPMARPGARTTGSWPSAAAIISAVHPSASTPLTGAPTRNIAVRAATSPALASSRTRVAPSTSNPTTTAAAPPGLAMLAVKCARQDGERGGEAGVREAGTRGQEGNGLNCLSPEPWYAKPLASSIY